MTDPRKPEDLKSYADGWMTERKHTDVAWRDGDGLVFGRETRGLPESILEANPDRLVKIPMPGEFHRSLNLAQAAAVGLYEAMRQTLGW